MKSSRKFGIFSASSTATVTYTYHNDHTDPLPTIEIPIESPTQPPTPITVHLPQHLQSGAATKIQSAFRAYQICSLYRKIASVDSEANHLQRLIQRQETVDSVRSDEREKLRMNEALMGLLLRLDSVPGIDPYLREARRKVSRRIVELQEILDGICGSNVDEDDFGEWGPYGYWRDMDKVVEKMEEDICREREVVMRWRDFVLSTWGFVACRGFFVTKIVVIQCLRLNVLYILQKECSLKPNAMVRLLIIKKLQVLIHNNLSV